MMMIRNKRLIRSIAAFFVVLFLSNTWAATVSYALTSGPSQPEFTSYEPMGTTDMVNLLTGDFTYNIPILEVPGPEGGFSMPLSYHSGIGMEQEASWVGLGWSLNPGAITRNVVQYPDDAGGEVATYVNVGEGGFSINNDVLTLVGWGENSEEGKTGYVNLLGVVGKSWSEKGGDDYNIAGVHINENEGVSWSPLETGEAVVAVLGLISSFGSLVDAGVSNAAAAATVATGEVVGGGVGSTIGAVGAGISTANYYGWDVSKSSEIYLLYNKYESEWYLDAERDESMYGTLYLGDLPTEDDMVQYASLVQADVQVLGVNLGYNTSFNELTWADDADYSVNYSLGGNSVSENPDYFFQVSNQNSSDVIEVASDMHMELDEGAASDLSNQFGTTSIALDGFSVKGNTVSGAIAPYRQDIGTLAYPKKMSPYHVKSNFKSFLSSTAYKPSFKYRGGYSNKYDYHDRDLALMGIVTSGAEHDLYNLNDDVLFDPNKRIESDRYGIVNKKLVQGNNIEWFTNDEIEADAHIGKMLEYDDADFNASTYRAAKPGHGIGGFSITDESGLTYHYALPIYNSYQQSENKKDASNYSSMTINDEFATTWLLTAITGADFVDRGNTNGSANNILDEDDWGYWVKFEYGMYTDDYDWRIPFDGSNNLDFKGEYTQKSEGTREVYYLDKINTRTHTQLFIKDIRKDAKSKNDVYSLKLEETILLNNTDYESLVQSGFSRSAGSSESVIENNVLDLEDIENPNLRSNFQSKQLRRTKFNYDYTLCDNTPNSWEIDNYTITSIPSYYFYSPSTSDVVRIDNEDINMSTFFTVGDDITFTKGGTTYECEIIAIDVNARTLAIDNCTGGTITSSDDMSITAKNSTTINENLYGKVYDGKLTLTSISVKGKNDFTTTPDSYFYYDNLNPDYNQDKWDGWGKYNSVGKNEYGFHKASTVANDGLAWNLTRIKTPLGAEIEIDYDRDSYTSVSGEKILRKIEFEAIYDAALDDFIMIPKNNQNQIDFINDAGYSNGDQITIFVDESTQLCECGINVVVNGWSNCFKDKKEKFNYAATLSQVSNNTFNFSAIANPLQLIPDYVTNFTDPETLCEEQVRDCAWSKIVRGHFYVELDECYGGDVRVSRIDTKVDDVIQNSIRYAYTKDGTFGGESSGVVSKEPSFADPYEYDFYKHFDYPSTPVLYENVSVYKSWVGGPNDYATKDVFNFSVPDKKDIITPGPIVKKVFEKTATIDLKQELKQEFFEDFNVFFSCGPVGLGLYLLNKGTLSKVELVATIINSDTVNVVDENGR